MKKPFDPLLRTPPAEFSKEEKSKLAGQGFVGNLHSDFRDSSREDLPWESESLAKSHGIYLEYNRAKSGDPKDWMYMVRINIPAGGPLTPKQYALLDELSEIYTRNTEGYPSIRLTTRQNIQFHWVTKSAVLDIVKRLAESGLNTLNGCGDNTRNVMACPLSRFSTLFDANALAQEAGRYFQLPVEPFIRIWEIDPHYVRKPQESFGYGPQLLNRKFKIAFSSFRHDSRSGAEVPENCVELLSDDLAIAPILANGTVDRFQIYVGGGQGERNGKPSSACLAQPFAQVDRTRLFAVMDGIVQTHQTLGDRKARHWARLKYVIRKIGVDSFRTEVENVLGYRLDPANPSHDCGARELHHGWSLQPSDGRWTYGLFVENGRITDGSPNGKIKTMIRNLMDQFPTDFMITPNQDAMFTNIPAEAKNDFENELVRFGYGQRNGKPFSALRLNSGACVGRDTCRMTYTDAERFEPELIDQLEALGWGDLPESIGITGCERQCFRPATKTIGVIGSGLNRYQFKLMGDNEGRQQGRPVIGKDNETMYLRYVPREKVAVVIDALARFHRAEAKPSEPMGPFHQRVGMDAIIERLKNDAATAELMKPTTDTDCVLD